MNPLAPLPASNSTGGSLNKLDWEKIGRMMLVQLAGLVLTFVPTMLGMKYVYNGTDYTPIVLVLVNGAAETLRRFAAENKPTLPPAKS